MLFLILSLTILVFCDIIRVSLLGGGEDNGDDDF